MCSSDLAHIKRQKLRETLEQHREQAFLSQQLVTLRDDGFQKVLKGLTTPDEILRVTENSN